MTKIEIGKQVETLRKELKLLDKILSDNDCAYIRILS